VVSISTQQVAVERRLQRAPNGQFYVVQTKGLRPVLGSGVIVDAQGRIVTNEHVIHGATQINAPINVQLADGRTAPAKILGSDPSSDLAVLKIDLPRLPVMTLGRSDRLEVGDVVLAVGTPLGLQQTVTQGIVSATGRKDMGLTAFEDFIQTDAAINPGNSGGALINTRGELVGINTAIIKDEKDEEAAGLGLAIPVDLVRGVLQDILKHGHVVRGWIGWAVGAYTEEEARQKQLPYSGLVVEGLAPNSTARQPGGLEIGDKVETIDGKPVRTTLDVITLVAVHKPGSTVKISGTRRNGQPYSAEVNVIDDPSAQ
jgi:S1-C subfamily serine protease